MDYSPITKERNIKVYRRKDEKVREKTQQQIKSAHLEQIRGSDHASMLNIIQMLKERRIADKKYFQND
jgi:hypothetical protein